MSDQQKNIVQEDEIDLIELAKVIWSKRLFIIKVTGVFILLGLIIAFTSKVEYEASAKLLPESQEGSMPNLGGLGGLAGLAGFDISSFGGEGQVLSPELFPEIVGSTPFIINLIKKPVFFEHLDTTISSYNYFVNFDKPSLIEYALGYTIGLPGKIKKMFSNDESTTKADLNAVRLTKEEWKIIKKYSDRLIVSVDRKTGIVSVTVELPDPVAAASVAKLLIENLTEEITQYKTDKSLRNLNFVKEQFLIAKDEYEKKQNQIALFTDANRNMTSSVIQMEYSRLQNEVDIAFEVYKGLANQLEQAKIQINNETPVFTLLEPVRIPESRSKPNRVLIIILAFLVGLVVSNLIVIYQIHIK